MRLLICAGGTGGGVYPALAVLQSLANRVERRSGFERSEAIHSEHIRAWPELEILWVGSEGGMEEELIKQTGVAFETIPAAGVHGVGWRALSGNLLRLGRGYRRSRQILNGFQPEVLFFTGGYLAVPMALAGRKTPSLLYVPDIEPGLALKTVARFAHRIAVTIEASRRYFPSRNKVFVTGYPTRRDLNVWSKEAALKTLGLTETPLILLVYGGSKGARSINRALLPVLPDLLREVQVVHITGRLDWPEVEAFQASLAQNLPEAGLAGRYHAFPYLHEEMGAALSAADLVVSRAGASVLGELPLFGLPAVLVPYPYSWRYQMVNAQFLVENGAAVMIRDEDLPGRILPLLQDLFNDKDRREQMKKAMRKLARPDAAEEISRLIVDMASEREPGKEARP